MSNRPLRQIRSFVLRTGRLTSGQQEALDNEWPRLGIEYQPAELCWEEVFGNKNPVVIEIGFGNGESLATMAKAEPNTNFLGIEVHTPGVGHLLGLAASMELTNLRVMKHDAIDILEHMVPDASLEKLQLFFPDPWHKKRHHKRRIVQPEFLSLVAKKLGSGGVFHMATDWEPYAEHAHHFLTHHPAFRNSETNARYSPKPAYRPTTKFETRGQRLGHKVCDLIWIRS